jgi:hypothetical protein
MKPLPTWIRAGTIKNALFAGADSPAAQSMFQLIKLEQAKAVILDRQSAVVGLLDDVVYMILVLDQAQPFAAWLKLDGELLSRHALARLAAETGSAKILKLLLHAGVSVHHTRKTRGSLVNLAIKRNSKECLNALLDAGANVNRRETVGRFPGKYPVHVAASANSLKCLRRLIAVGADLNVRDGFGFTATELAKHEGNSAALRMLIRAGAKPPTAKAATPTP